MNQESTNQVQGQESVSIVDTTKLQNQLLDTSNIQLQNSEITQDCSLDKIENLTSSHEITKPKQSIVTQVPSEAQKSLIRNLYNLLVCEKLPATDESSNLSMITNKIYSALEIEENEDLDRKIEEFIEILEVLSEPCDKIKRHDCTKNFNKIEKMTKNVRLRIKKIKIEKSRLVLLIKEVKLENIAHKYETLKKNEVLMKILFHKCYQVHDMCQTRCVDGNEAVGDIKPENESNCQEESKFFSANNKNFKKLRNFRSENQKLVFKDLCEKFESVVVPKTQNIIASVQLIDNLTWNALDDSTKSVILKSFIDFQGFYIPLQELIQNNPEYLQNLKTQQIIDIVQYGFTKVSKIEQLNIPFYLNRTFIWKHMDSFVDQNPYIFTSSYYTERKQNQEFITEHTKNYYDLKEELKVRKILILTDEFGSGKTTTLKYFARRFKEDDNKLWISYVDSRLSPKIFDKIEKIQEWNADSLIKFLIEILGLAGIEVSIFKQKFMDNQVILLWDHIDEKYQPILIDFAYNIKQFSENQQIFATRFRYSEKLAQKFDRTAYKFIPYTTEQIEEFQRKTEDFMNFYVGSMKFINFCDSIGLGDGHYYHNREIFFNNNILMFKLILLAFVDLKMDPDYRVDLYLLFDRVFDKQLMDCPHKLTENENIVLEKFLQAHAIKTVFGDELTKSVQIVKNSANTQPPISHLKGIFTLNFDDNSVDLQHKIIIEYFVTKFIMANVIAVDIRDVKVNEAKILVTIFSMIFSQHKYKRLLKLINHAFELKYRNSAETKEAHDNIFRIIKKAQFWPKVTKVFSPKQIQFTVHVRKFRTVLNDFDFWTRLYNEIQLEKEKNEEKEKLKHTGHQTENVEVKKNVKEVKDRPTVKGVTSMKKLNNNLEISHQLNEYLEDVEEDESD